MDGRHLLPASIARVSTYRVKEMLTLFFVIYTGHPQELGQEVHGTV